MSVNQRASWGTGGNVLCLFLAAFSMGQEPERVTVRPADNGQALVNPDMGWTMHFYSNISSTSKNA